MSTICKILANVSSIGLADATRAYLGQKGIEFSESVTEWPSAADHVSFQPDEEFPCILSINQVTAEVAELHFNSFANMQELASYLSEALQTDIVVNIYQSVSTASYWALHSGGRLIRAIEAGDGEITRENGDRLPFEGSNLGHNISRDDEPFYMFDDDDQDRYNRGIGIAVGVYEDYPPTWLNFVTPEPPEPEPLAKRAWWQLWR